MRGGFHTVRLWDVASGQEKATLQGHTSSVESVAFSPDGTTLASASDDRTVVLWELASGQEKATFQGHTHAVISVAFSPDGTTLASGSWDGTVLLWDMSPYITTPPVATPDSTPLSRTEVEATILGDAVESLTVEFSRAISGRRPDYAWSAVTDSAGRAALSITSPAPPGVSGFYRARARNPAGEIVSQWNSIPLNRNRRQILELTLGGDVRMVAVERLDAAKEGAASEGPAVSGLSPNFPNPFNSTTQIAYRLATPGPVRLEIYNALGQPVRTLIDQVQAAGFYQVHWDALDQRGAAVAAGVYLIRLYYPDGVQSRKLLCLK